MKHWTPTHLAQLITSLSAAGYRVLGPQVQDQAIMYADLDDGSALPTGYGDAQEAGHYRLIQRDDESRFGFNLGPATWKQFLFPPEETIFSVKDGQLRSERSKPEKMAFIGVRACEMAAIRIQDRVFDQGLPEPGYSARRARLFLVAVNCSQAAATCFCDSTGDGPAVRDGADLVLTEVNPADPFYLAEAGSKAGEEMLARIGGEPATDREIAAGEAAVERARQQMSRRLEPAHLGAALLDKLDHPHWHDVADRCLACGNCTQVCPTCFCSTSQEQTDPVSLQVNHVRLWDSCFTAGHSSISGGVVHESVYSRYRQWLTHKLGSWEAQFGVSGCTGCGRCITWCPVGIDLTAEVRRLQETA